MSSKHLRKLLQEKEENELPGAGESASESEEEDEKPVRSAPVNRFAALGLVHDDEDEEEDEPQEVVPKPSAPSNPSKTDKKKKKKANKKNRKKESDKKVEEDVEENAEEASAEVGRQQLYAKYLVVDAKDVNPENEMKRLLGKAFGAAPTANSKRRNATFVPGRIVKAKPTWPPVGSGLSSEIVKKEGDVTWFKFTHNAAYRNLQQLFWAGEKSYDHGLIQTIMEQNPYHLDSLLVMANMMRVQEDVQVARDLIERGVYACDMSTNAPFFVFEPNHRLSYYQRENRSFFLLLHRHMRNAADRRCFFTALQLCKLILMKDPDSDCLGTLLEIDTRALRAKEYEYLVDLYCNLKHKNLDLLPNFVYSVALAYFKMGEGFEELASTALQNALLRFPTVLMQILDKISVQPDKSIDNNMEMNAFAHDKTSLGFQMLTQIYVHHSHELWKEPEVLQWLEKETSAFVPKLMGELKKEFLAEKEACLKRYAGTPRTSSVTP
ncbi:hypothetical protein L596_028997 [Steinernema carpocapsae]|uniref:Transcription factor 25 n=1 Tax=Steinernema carpocapsae TaxID=34508 RepID=A0A4U5LTB5_STECR|nr:hypothetical protein L596_028997 [Steinernema carpocapsae]